jgi:hypothetical protein
MNFIIKIKLPLLLITICLLSTCKREKEPTLAYPLVNTLDVVNITNQGATFRGDIYSAGSEPIIDYGFVWGKFETDLSVESNDRISLGSRAGTGSFESEIKTTLEANKKYFVRSFVKSASHTVYGKVISFLSLGSGAPIITGFEPKTAGWGDTLLVKGRNFSWHGSTNKVYIGSVLSYGIVQSTDSTLKAIIPVELGVIRNTISVEIVGNKATYMADTFELIPPSIIDFKPKTGHWGDTITIYGKYLNYITYNLLTNFIKLNQLKCTNIIRSSKDSICFTIPNDLVQLDNTLSIFINGITINAAGVFHLIAPVITDFKPKTGTWDDQITLYGNFNPNASYNRVSIGINSSNSNFATITQSTKDSIKIKVPLTLVNGTANIYLYTNTYFSGQSSSAFHLKPPVISSFTPTISPSNYLMTITGDFFKNGITQVFFDNVQATISSCTKTAIQVTIPSHINGPCKVKVTVGDQSVFSVNDFTFTNPKITSFSPLIGTFLDTITIIGENFSSLIVGNFVRINGISSQVVFASATKIKSLVSVNQTNTPGYISVQTGSNNVISTEKFNLLAPEISLVSPISGNRGQEITIQGNNFNPSSAKNVVYFGTVLASTISANKTELKVNPNKLPSGEYKANLTMNGYQVESIDNYASLDPWKSLANMGIAHDIKYPFSIDGFGYLLSVNIGNYYVRKFDPNTYTWSPLNSPPFTASSSSPIISFTVNNKIYLLSGNNRFDSFDPSTNLWAQLNNCPTIFTSESFTFTIGSKAYLGAAEGNLKFWAYDFSTDSWAQKNDLPAGLVVPYINYYIQHTNKSAFAINDKGYLINYQNAVWEYNPVNDSWMRKNDFPGGKRFWASSFVIGSKGYIAGGLYQKYGSSNVIEYDDLWEYNNETDIWVMKTSSPGHKRWKTIGFSLINKLYYGSGCYYSTDWGTIANELSYFEYDPTLEP